MGTTQMSWNSVKAVRKLRSRAEDQAARVYNTVHTQLHPSKAYISNRLHNKAYHDIINTYRTHCTQLPAYVTDHDGNNITIHQMHDDIMETITKMTQHLPVTQDDLPYNPTTRYAQPPSQHAGEAHHVPSADADPRSHRCILQ